MSSSVLVRGATRRPGPVTAAAVLLALCAVLQVGFFVVLAASGTGGGALTAVILTGAFWGLVGFAAAAGCVWRGRRVLAS